MRIIQKGFTFLMIIGITANSFNCFSQHKVTGIITDSLTRQALAGVNVRTVDTPNSTLTNENGEFQILVNKLPVQLTLSHVSYRKVKIMITDSGHQHIRLHPAVIQLPEARAGNPALALLNAVIRKALSDTVKRHYYKAFYQRVSSHNGKYTRLHEIFFNASWGQLGLDRWEPLNFRYARADEQVYSPRNMTFVSFLYSAVMYKHTNFPLNTINLTDNYDFTIKHYINAGTEEEIAVIACKSKIKELAKPQFNGDIFIRTSRDNLVRISGENTYREKNKWVRTMNLDANFKEDQRGFSVFDNVYLLENRRKKYSGNDTAEKIWLYFYEEIQGMGDGNIYPAYQMDESRTLKASPYNPVFWQGNVPLKHTRQEEEIIRYFERKGKFFANF